MKHYQHNVCPHGTIASIREHDVTETNHDAPCPPSCPANFGLAFTPKDLPDWWRAFGSGTLRCVHGAHVASGKETGRPIVMHQAVSLVCDACRWFERSTSGTLDEHKPTRVPRRVETHLGVLDALIFGAGRVHAGASIDGYDG